MISGLDQGITTGHLIHIGFPKCASKFLQRWFAEHPQVAYEQGSFAGVRHVPGLIASVLAAPVNAICRVTSNEELSDPRDPATFGEIVTTAMDEHHAVIGRVCTELAALFPDAKILIVTRKPADLIISGYSELIRQGSDVTDTDFARLAADGFPDAHWFDYDHTLKLYRARFGGRVLALPFEMLVEDRRGFLAKVADFMEVDHFDIDVGRLNESLDGEQLYWYPRIARILKMAPSATLRRKLDGIHRRMIAAGTWRPVLKLLKFSFGARTPTRLPLTSDFMRRLQIDCEELLNLECYVPYRELYRRPASAS